MGIGNRIKEARLNLGYTQEELAKLLGVTKGAVANYEVGTSHPKEPIMYKLFDALHVDANYLFQDEMGSNYPMKVSYSEMERIKKYRFISEHSPENADIIDTAIDKGYSVAEQLQAQQERINALEARQQEISGKIQSIRIYTYMRKIACAGDGFYFDDIPTETIEAPYMEGADFIIGVNGDSMEPDYFDGDKVYVKKTSRLNLGDVGIFTVGNECYIKEFGKDGLMSKNKDYPDIPGNADIRIVGKVIGKVPENI